MSLLPNFSSPQNLLKWGANAASLGGGAGMAAVPALSLSPWLYLLFLFSHMVWTGVAVHIREKELAYLNMGALCLDIWAISTRLAITAT